MTVRGTIRIEIERSLAELRSDSVCALDPRAAAVFPDRSAIIRGGLRRSCVDIYARCRLALYSPLLMLHIMYRLHREGRWSDRGTLKLQERARK